MVYFLISIYKPLEATINVGNILESSRGSYGYQWTLNGPNSSTWKVSSQISLGAQAGQKHGWINTVDGSEIQNNHRLDV